MKKDGAQLKEKKWYLSWWALVIYFFVFIKLISFMSDSQQVGQISQQQTTQQNSQEQIKEKEKNITSIIQESLDMVFKDTSLQYRAEVEMEDIKSYGIIGWLNVYPLNEQSWEFLPLSKKKDFVAVLVNMSRAEISSNLGQVYIKNNIRVLAEGVWDALDGVIIEIK